MMAETLVSIPVLVKGRWINADLDAGNLGATLYCWWWYNVNFTQQMHKTGKIVASWGWRTNEGKSFHEAVNMASSLESSGNYCINKRLLKRRTKNEPHTA